MHKRSFREKLQVKAVKKRKLELNQQDDSADTATDSQENQTVDSNENVSSPTPPASKYIPPYRRQANEEENALQKYVKSLINKLSMSNLEHISAEFETIYQKNSRNQVNDVLTKNIMELVTDPSMVVSNLASVASNTALIAILHLSIGTEIGAYFIEMTSKQFKSYYDSKKSKECSNLIIMFTHLYNFQVIHCNFIYDIIRMLVDHFTQLDIELLLLLLKHIGFQLRSDDPSALKEIILSVKQQAIKMGVSIDKSEDTSNATKETNEFNLRAKFMLQTIYNLKNNKRHSNEDETTVQQLKKLIKHIFSKKSGYNENPLRVTWTDMISVQDKGRWWLVGSSWAGSGPQQPSSAPSTVGVNDDNLIQLAKDHHMNTDLRKAVFCAIMSSEDYLDSFEKLAKLNLKGKQEREIASIIVYCCQHEKKYNEFYAHLASKLCGSNSNYKFSLQTVFWDKFKSFETLTNARQIANLASLLAALIKGGELTLVVLKVVEFQKLNTTSILFFRLFFTDLLTKCTLEEVSSIFTRALASKASLGLKDGIGFFFLQEGMHFQNVGSMTEQNILYLKRIKLANTILNKAEEF